MTPQLENAIRHRVAEFYRDHPKLTDRKVLDVFTAYQDYFAALLLEEDVAPPDSEDALTELLLVAIWDLIVEREELCLEDILFEDPLRPALDQCYQVAFARLREEPGKRGKKYLNGLEDEIFPVYNYRWLLETHGIKASPYDPYTNLALLVLPDTEYDPDQSQVQFFERLLLENESEPSVYIALTQAYLSSDREEAAEELLAAAVRQFPDHPGVRAWYVINSPEPRAAIERGKKLKPLTEYPPGKLGFYDVSHYQLGEEAFFMIALAKGSRDETEARLNNLRALGHDEAAVESLESMRDILLSVMSEVREEAVVRTLKPRVPSEADKPEPETEKKIYQLRISIDYGQPEIWRRILVPAVVTLPELHQIIQNSFSWENYHLHEFQFEGKRLGPPAPFEDPGVLDYTDFQLNWILKFEGNKLRYVYDFGDDWAHTILLEKVLDPEPGQRYPNCVAGRRAGPPEDSGGIPGYEYFLEALANPSRKNREIREWRGEDWNAEAFSVDEVNARLHG